MRDLFLTSRLLLPVVTVRRYARCLQVVDMALPALLSLPDLCRIRSRRFLHKPHASKDPVTSREQPPDMPFIHDDREIPELQLVCSGCETRQQIRRTQQYLELCAARTSTRDVRKRFVSILRISQSRPERSTRIQVSQSTATLKHCLMITIRSSSLSRLMSKLSSLIKGLLRKSVYLRSTQEISSEFYLEPKGQIGC